MLKYTKVLTMAGATAVIAASGLLMGAGAASANPSDTNTCQPGQVSAFAKEVPSNSADTANFVIEFRTTTPGTQCLLTGLPQDLVFHDAGGSDLGLSNYTTGSQNKQVLLDDTHPAQVDLHSPVAQDSGAPSVQATFTMANSTTGIPFSIAWPTDVNGPVEIGQLTGGAS
jgi:hypothetical protein